MGQMNASRGRGGLFSGSPGEEASFGGKSCAMSCGRQEICSTRLWAAAYTKSDSVQGQVGSHQGWEKPQRHKREPGRGCCGRISSFCSLGRQGSTSRGHRSASKLGQKSLLFLLHGFSFYPLKNHQALSFFNFLKNRFYFIFKGCQAF